MFQKIFVTGADGFIGSHLVEKLVEEGHQVRALVQYNSFNTKGWLDHIDTNVLSQIDVVAGNVCDPFQMRELMRGHDVVMHLAALIAIPYSYVAPQSYVDTNVTGTLNILQAAREHGVSKVVHTSTSEVYGTAISVPIMETHPLQGQSPYSASKIAADQMAFAYHSSFDLPVVTIRPFNTYGPRQSVRAVLPTIITQLARGKREIELGALTPTRDLNFVKDTVAGFVAALNSQNGIGKTINIGSNFEISVGDAANEIVQLMGVDAQITSSNERFRPANSEVERLWADNQKAKELLDWTPAYGQREGFRRGLEETIAWFTDKNNLQLYNDHGYVI